MYPLGLSGPKCAIYTPDVLKEGEFVSLGLAYLVETADDLYPDSVINGTVSRCTNPGTFVFPYCTNTTNCIMKGL